MAKIPRPPENQRDLTARVLVNEAALIVLLRAHLASLDGNGRAAFLADIKLQGLGAVQGFRDAAPATIAALAESSAKSHIDELIAALTDATSEPAKQ
jgi:hypothetical protein